MNKLIAITLFLLCSPTLNSCMSAYIKSMGGNTSQVLERIYLSDFNIAWQAVLEVLKNTRMDVTNKEGGFIQTNWTENTAEKNFIDSFGDTGTYLKAQFRLKISLEKGNYRGKSNVKIKIIKEQLIQKDALEGWRAIETDSIEEKTILYRIGRVIFIKTKIIQDEEERGKKEIEGTHF